MRTRHKNTINYCSPMACPYIEKVIEAKLIIKKAEIAKKIARDVRQLYILSPGFITKFVSFRDISKILNDAFEIKSLKSLLEEAEKYESK